MPRALPAPSSLRLWELEVGGITGTNLQMETSRSGEAEHALAGLQNGGRASVLAGGSYFYCPKAM